jgi:formate hydrogenlyase subunit 6/NADH:ubiquinone oxidoreductase subunit I
MVPLPDTVFENRFMEYLAIMLSRCIGCQECQKTFVPSGHLSFERAKKQGAKSGE